MTSLVSIKNHLRLVMLLSVAGLLYCVISGILEMSGLWPDTSTAQIFSTFVMAASKRAGLGLLLTLVTTAVLTCVVCLRVMRSVHLLEPMARMAQNIAAGDCSQSLAYQTKDEIGLLARTMNHMAT